MKIDQIAFGCKSKYVWDKIATEAAAVDTVFFSGMSGSPGNFRPVENLVGYLAFDYKHEIEREYLFYPLQDGTFHKALINPQTDELFLSHLGSHVDSIDLYLAENGKNDVVMDVTTFRHTNPKLVESGRTYRYVILDWRRKYGYFYKLIQRIEKP